MKGIDSICEQCPVGTSTVGSTQCTRCPSGKITHTAGSVCFSCIAGKYANLCILHVLTVV